jgi:hypothetical protein
MMVGCDFHTRFQQVAMLDPTTGEAQPQRATVMRPGAREIIAPHVVRSLRPQAYTRAIVQPQPTSQLLFLGYSQPFPPPAARGPDLRSPASRPLAPLP